MAKTSEIHFDPDGVVTLRGTSTADAPEFSKVVQAMPRRLRGGDIKVSVSLRPGPTLVVEASIGPKGWQQRRTEAAARAKAFVSEPEPFASGPTGGGLELTEEDLRPDTTKH